MRKPVDHSFGDGITQVVEFRITGCISERQHRQRIDGLPRFACRWGTCGGRLDRTSVTLQAAQVRHDIRRTLVAQPAVLLQQLGDNVAKRGRETAL